MEKENHLARLHAARQTNKMAQAPDFQEAMKGIKQYSDQLSGLEAEDLKEIDELMDKVDSLAGIFDKYAKLQEKMVSLQENAVFIERSLEDLANLATETAIDPFAGCTEDETYAISTQLIKEFEDDTRLAQDLFELSKTQELEEEVPDEVPAYKGLTKEQTVQVYMQVMDEFEGGTELSKRLAYNAGV